MIINLREYFDNYIGDVSWYGETNHDDISRENMQKAPEVLYFLELVKYDILGKLNDHKNYRKGNASAEMLHEEARKICERFDENYQENDWLVGDTNVKN